jgi:organic radical activating enzyme
MSRRYLVNEMFGPTLLGDGAHAGRACVFLHLSHAQDTGLALTADEIVARLRELDTSRTHRAVVIGKQASLAWDAELAAAIRRAGFRVHLETDGTHPLAGPVDWLAIAPDRPSAALADGLHADEVKVVVDDAVDEATLDRYAARWRCEHYFVQPRVAERHLDRTLALIQTRPRWRLSVQIHKILSVPRSLHA